MRNPLLVLILGAVVTAGVMSPVAAAPPRDGWCAPPRLVVVLDRSSSMNGAIGAASKWVAARSTLDQVLTSYEHTIGFGLATFPYPNECGPGRLDLAPALAQRARILAALATPPPDDGNWTPLGETLLALADEPEVTGVDRPTYLVVVTDGFQWCAPFDPDARTLPIDGVLALRDSGVRTFVVGFGAGVDVATLSAMAVAGGTARVGCDPTASAAGPAAPCYYQADDAPALLSALMAVASIASDEVCDQRDNDCDGVIDEDGACPLPPPPTPASVDAGLDDAGDLGLDGVPSGGCGCRVPGGGDPAGGLLVLAVLVAWLSRRSPGARRLRPAPAWWPPAAPRARQ